MDCLFSYYIHFGIKMIRTTFTYQKKTKQNKLTKEPGFI